MDDAFRVRGVEGIGDWTGDCHGLGRSELSPLAQHGTERPSVDVFENEVDGSRVATDDVVNADHGWMDELSSDLSFADESTEGNGFRGVSLVEQLDGDRLLELDVAGAEHNAHASAAKNALETVAAVERGADSGIDVVVEHGAVTITDAPAIGVQSAAEDATARNGERTGGLGIGPLVADAGSGTVRG